MSSYERDMSIDKNTPNFTLLQHRRMYKRPGIYIIVNKKNGKFYIGSSYNAQDRVKQHFRALKKGNHNNMHLQHAWNKYGEENFKYDVLMYCRKEDVIENEQNFINTFLAANPKFGYNKCPNASSTIGYKWTEEQKERRQVLRTHKGQIPWMKGKHHSEESRLLIGLSKIGKVPWNKGVLRTEEEKQKMSQNRKGSTSWNKGIKTSKAVSEKIAKANRERVWKQESLDKLSKARKGATLPESHCIAISIGLKGHIMSQETKNKISQSLKNKQHEL